MHRELKQSVADEFLRYKKFLGPVRYESVKPWKNFLDWLALWYMYRKDPSIQKDGEVCRFIRHYYRTITLEDGEAFVFLTHVVSLIESFDDPDGSLESSLYWKYSLSSSPLDTVSTSMDCSTALDRHVPLIVRRSVKISEADDELLEQTRPFKCRGFMDKLKKLWQLVKT